MGISVREFGHNSLNKSIFIVYISSGSESSTVSITTHKVSRF
jgi:hypothetical protein